MARSHSFDVNIRGDVEQTLDRVRELIGDHGGSLQGDDQEGEIHGLTPLGAIRGRYAVQGKTCQITITEKPALAPMKRIEKAVREYFARVG